MTALTILLFAVVLGVVGWYLFSPAVSAWQRFRGQMIVTCPETRTPVAARIDTGHLAVSAAERSWDMRIDACDRWPERADCDQACLHQIEDHPEHCAVRERLRDWYRGKSCVKCGTVFEDIESYDHEAQVAYDKKPALISPVDEIVEWHDVPPAQLLMLLETHYPVCWDCATIETFRRKRPERVIDREFTYRSLHF